MAEYIAAEGERSPRAHVVVVGNSKGGTGKSTTAMHVAASLLYGGFAVGTIDLDAEQGTLSRYLENRRLFAERRGTALPLPLHRTVEPSRERDRERAAADERQRFEAALAGLAACCRFVVIDTPAGEAPLSVLGHSFADTLLTPLNDSFVDLDVLGLVEAESHKVRRPSRYSALVWEIKKERARRDRGSVDWVVMRNRLGHVDARNKRAMAEVLAALAARIGFRLAPGLSERVIYRELFLKGLTLLDLREEAAGVKLSMSHIAARRELGETLHAIGLAARVREAVA
ncbi:MAG: division plane positioning ATPase MipZ [Alphaproteobacteria bacterium]